MTAFINIDKNKLERIEDKIWSIGSIIGQILLPIGIIMLLFLTSYPSMIFIGILESMELSILYIISALLFTLLGFGCTGNAGLDENTIWHKLNRKLKVFGYK